MSEYNYDLFVIGAGSGGVRAACKAAELGAGVAIAEQHALGGTCVNLGCVPKKLLVYAAQYAEQFQQAAAFGWTTGKPGFNWSSLIANKNRELDRLQAVYRTRLQKSGVSIISGQASLLDAHTVKVNGDEYSAERILIATGGRPSEPDIPGRQHIQTSNDMFILEQLPKQAIIIGGAYIAVEFAGILNGLGVKTTICHRGNRLLRGFDEDIGNFLAQEMRKKGVDILFNTHIEAIEKSGDELTVWLMDGSIVKTQLVMAAAGRIPNSNGFGLEAIGVELNNAGAIKVNQHYATNVPSVYALGDVTDRVKLTPVAVAEGECLANYLYGDPAQAVDYQNIPTAVFCRPAIGMVGLSEGQARQKYPDIDIYKTEFIPLKHAFSGLNEKNLMKMIVVRSTELVVGVHMVGADAPEIIQGMAIAIRAGATKSVFDSTIGIHPTAAEEFVSLSRVPV